MYHIDVLIKCYFTFECNVTNLCIWALQKRTMATFLWQLESSDSKSKVNIADMLRKKKILSNTLKKNK